MTLRWSVVHSDDLIEVDVKNKPDAVRYVVIDKEAVEERERREIRERIARGY